MHARDLAQSAQMGDPVAIGDAPGLDAQGQVPATVVATVPAEAVAVVLEHVLAYRREGEAAAAFDFGAEPVESAILDRVLEAGALAHFAIAEIALRGQHGLGDGEDLIRTDEAEGSGQQRVGFGIAVAGAHAAADRDIEAGQDAVLDDRDEAEIVGEDVDIVVRRHGEGDLELAWQIGLAVQRLALGFAAGNALLVEPDLVVGAAVRLQVFGQARGLLMDDGVHV